MKVASYVQLMRHNGYGPTKSPQKWILMYNANHSPKGGKIMQMTKFADVGFVFFVSILIFWDNGFLNKHTVQHVYFL